MFWMAILGCPLPDLNDRDGDGADDQVDCNDEDDEVGSRCPSVCPGGWGPILDVAPNADLVVPEEEDVEVLHVQAGAPDVGEPENDGRVRQPFADLDLAIREALRRGGEVVVAVSAGTYPINVSVYRESDTPGLGLSIVGCGAGDVILEPLQPDRPVLEIRSQDLDRFDGIDATYTTELRGVTVQGGRRAIRAVGSVNLTVADVRIEEAEYYAIQGYGKQVRLGLSDVEIDQVQAYAPPFSATALGVGVGALRGAVVEVEGLDITGAIGAGLVLTGDTVDGVAQRIEEVTIREVAPTGGRLGRGLIAEGLMNLMASELRIERTHDAAVFVRNLGDLTLTSLIIDDVQSATTPGYGPADGVVVVQDAFDLVPNMFFFYDLQSIASVTAPTRAAVVAAGVLEIESEAVDDTFVTWDGAAVVGDAPKVISGVPLLLDLEAFPDDPPN
ncbi:MAG: hypothetical protein AAGA48_38090 [Myxococcota bacterium]